MTTAARRWGPGIAIALLGLAATITSLGHDFTYDDRAMIFGNTRVQSMLHLPWLWTETYWPPWYGGDGYRPIVTTLFALQWTAGNGAPWVFHLFNIVLAVATALAVYWCARAILPRTGAWVAAALFAVHPVHVEVTGNVVGQSELLVALFLTLAMGLYLRRRISGALSGRDVISIAALFAIGLLCKEHAIVLPFLIIAAEWCIVPAESWRTRVTSLRLLALSLVVVALLYLVIRGIVQADLKGFLPYPAFRFLRMSALDRIGTMMNEMPRVAKLLALPTHLSADYSPADVVVASGFSYTMIPGLFITLGVAILAVALRRRAPVASFGLLWLIIAFLPVSNLLVPAGFIVAERTLFFPSVGLMLVAGVLAERLRASPAPIARPAGLAALALLLAAGMARSVNRQRVWKNNDVFFEALMRDAPNGYRAHFMHAAHLGQKGRLHDMEKEYRRAIRIFPYDASMTLQVADRYTRAGLCEPAIPLFEWTYAVEPAMAQGRYEYVYCLARRGRWEEARREAITGIAHSPNSELKYMREAIRQANAALQAKGSAR